MADFRSKSAIAPIRSYGVATMGESHHAQSRNTKRLHSGKDLGGWLVLDHDNLNIGIVL